MQNQRGGFGKSIRNINRQAGIDLHIHSTASDGTLSPSKILDLAQKLNLRAIAITDHDTIDGSKAAFRAGIPPSLQFLTGIEISAAPPPAYASLNSLHILGYAFRLDDPVLNKTLKIAQRARENRNPQILDRLRSMGIHLSILDVQKEARQGQLGRPHIARLMIEKGIVKTIDEAFDTYLAKGRPAFVDKYRMDCRRVIEIIIGAGGIPVLAHPYLLRLNNSDTLENLLRILKTMGLKGLEVYYPEHPPEQVAIYEKLSRRYDLLMTGGTDYHGAIKPEIEMGSGKGDFHVPYMLYETLLNAC